MARHASFTRRPTPIRLALVCLGLIAAAGATSCAPPPGPPPDFPVGCYAGGAGLGDIRYDGPINTLHNARYGTTLDGTCLDNGSQIPVTVIAAGSAESAVSRCQSYLPNAFAYALFQRYDIPQGFWMCFSYGMLP